MGDRKRKARKEAGRRERIRKAKGLRKAQSGSPPKELPAPSFIDLTYPDAATLQIVGPLIPAAWAMPSRLAAALEASGNVVPAPVRGCLLVDTGASQTCIALEAANALGLLPRRIEQSYGAGGLTDNPVFWARLVIEIENEAGAKTTAERDGEVVAVPRLEESMRGVPLRVSFRENPDEATSVRLIGLLGRDLLRHASFLYDGPPGRCRLTFDLDSFRPAT